MHIGLSFTAAEAWEPVRAHPQNPYLLEFRGQPAPMAVFAESYDSVRDSGHDFIPYLNVLRRDGQNFTRVWLIGHPVDLPDSPPRFLQPWQRATSGPNAPDGLGKWDFTTWNEDYFARLKAFAQAASDRGIVVEFTFFSVLYDDAEWQNSPYHPLSNVQAYGSSVNRYQSFRLNTTPANVSLRLVLEQAVRRIVRELNPFDNVIYEIQNEPFWNEPGVGDAEEAAFHNSMLAVIRDEESTLPKRHLVAHNFPQQINNLSTGFDMINEHYPAAVPSTTIAGGELLLANHYSRGKILSLDESDTVNVPQTRLEGWMFLIGGGAIYDGKDAQHNVYGPADWSGDNPLGNSIRESLKNALTYMNQLHLVALRRDLSWILSGIPTGAKHQAVAVRGQQYVAYFHHGKSGLVPFQLNYDPIDATNHTAAPTVLLEAGSWRVVWSRPSDLAVLYSEEFTHAGGPYTLASVTYQEDVALRIDRSGSGDFTPPPIPAGLGATTESNGSVALSWNPVQAADLASYHLYRSTTPGVPTEADLRVATLTSAQTTFTDTSTTAGTVYYYVVTAVDVSGNESSASMEASTLRRSNTPVLGISTVEGGQHLLQWSSEFPGWRLQESPDLSLASWVNSTLPVTLVGDHYQTTAPPGQMRFFRLVGPPPPPDS